MLDCGSVVLDLLPIQVKSGMTSGRAIEPSEDLFGILEVLLDLFSQVSDGGAIPAAGGSKQLEDGGSLDRFELGRANPAESRHDFVVELFLSFPQAAAFLFEMVTLPHRCPVSGPGHDEDKPCDRQQTQDTDPATEKPTNPWTLTLPLRQQPRRPQRTPQCAAEMPGPTDARH